MPFLLALKFVKNTPSQYIFAITIYKLGLLRNDGPKLFRSQSVFRIIAFSH